MIVIYLMSILIPLSFQYEPHLVCIDEHHSNQWIKGNMAKGFSTPFNRQSTLTEDTETNTHSLTHKTEGKELHSLNTNILFVTIVSSTSILSNAATSSVFMLLSALMVKRTMSLYPYDAHGWTEVTSPPMPRAMARMSVGYDSHSHTIWLHGKDERDAVTMSFDYRSNTFTDYVPSLIFLPAYARSQNYVQIGSILYHARDQNKIGSFNMQTKVYSNDYVTTPSTSAGGNWENVCLVNIRDQYLAVIEANTDVHVLDTLSKDLDWLNHVPSTQSPHSSFPCAYANDRMFVFGGVGSVSIEYLDVSPTIIYRLELTSWQYSSTKLPILAGVRSVVAGDYILLIGGETIASIKVDPVDTVYAFNINSQALSFEFGYLAQAKAFTAPIVVDGTLYTFGGVGYGTVFSWQINSDRGDFVAITTSMVVTSAQKACMDTYGTNAASIISRVEFDTAHSLCQTLPSLSDNGQTKETLCCLGADNSRGVYEWWDGSDNTMIQNVETKWESELYGLWAEGTNTDQYTPQYAVIRATGSYNYGIHNSEPSTKCYPICHKPPPTNPGIVDCDDTDEGNYKLDYIGKPTQFRISDKCGGKFIEVNIDNLIELNGGPDGKATKNRVTSFDTSGRWNTPDTPNDDGIIISTFTAPNILRGAGPTELVLRTSLAVAGAFDVDVPINKNGDTDTITVSKGSVKLDIEINGWPFETEGNYLKLCVGITTNREGDIKKSDDGSTFTLDAAQIENEQFALCHINGKPLSTIGVTVTKGDKGPNQLTICYGFEACSGDIKYDPVYTLLPSDAQPRPSDPSDAQYDPVNDVSDLRDQKNQKDQKGAYDGLKALTEEGNTGVVVMVIISAILVIAVIAFVIHMYVRSTQHKARGDVVETNDQDPINMEHNGDKKVIAIVVAGRSETTYSQ